jgi:hypothetical protein
MKVLGLDVFARYFSSFSDCYCLIGGAALSLIYDHHGLSSRATKDLDVVVLLNAKTPTFVKAISRFIEEGGYQVATASPNYCSYRFAKPQNGAFPKQVEIFTKSQALGLTLKSSVQHLSLEAGVSFSSIVLDPVYFDYITAHSTRGEMTYIEDYAIVPLKAKAYLENKKLLLARVPGIYEDTVRKHARDVIRFVQDFPLQKISLPPPIKQDCEAFLQAVKKENYPIEEIANSKDFHLADFVRLFTEDYLS